MYRSSSDQRITPKGNKRKLRIKFDAAQYYSDIRSGQESCYESFNLLVRRKPEENTFKSILETIRALLNDVHGLASGQLAHGLPSWLQDIILGYGDPRAVHYRYDTIRIIEIRRTGS